MKIYLLLAIAALCVQASAQDRFATTPAPPAICKPCLFYGGDIDPNDPNADGFIDQNTKMVTRRSDALAALDRPGVTGSSSPFDAVDVITYWIFSFLRSAFNCSETL